MNFTIDHYTAFIDTCILVLLLVWSWMDRNNIYFKSKEEKQEEFRRKYPMLAKNYVNGDKA